MTTPVHAAARRLRGHLVATPLIGELHLPGFSVSPAVRVKAECVQTSGSVYYRGYLHALLRSLGRFKGLVLHGESILAQALAGRVHRLPMVAVAGGATDSTLRHLDQLEVEVRRDDAGPVAAQLAHDLGFQLFPGVADEDVREGISTLALELAAEMPAEVERVIVPDPALVVAIEAGMTAASRECRVLVGAAEGDRTSPPPEWPQAVAQGLRLWLEDRALAALWAQRGAEVPTCVIL